MHKKRKATGKGRETKATMTKQRQFRRMMDKQYVEGECVWNALLRGVSDLQGEHCTTHDHLLKRLQSQVSSIRDNESVTLFERAPVEWNGTWLGRDEYLEARTVILFETIVHKHGYDCRACDPLLLTVAAVFRVKIVHDMLGTPMVYSTQNSRRVVYISSSHGHMVHDRNIDIKADCIPELMEEEEMRVKGDAICSVCGVLFPFKINMVRHQSRHGPLPPRDI